MVLGLGEVTGSDSFINIFNFKICVGIQLLSGFPGGSDDKESACSTGDQGSIPLGREDPLEKGMAIHSSLLAWNVPRTEESGGRTPGQT